MKKRNVDFWERTIILFFEPIVQKLNDMRNIISKKEINTEEFDKVIKDVYGFFKTRRYMISEENAEKVTQMFLDFLNAEAWDMASKKRFFASEFEVRNLIVAEWKNIENKIREFYELKGGRSEKLF